MFKRMKQALGVGGPEVDTVLRDPNVRPGGAIEGEVRIVGGDDAREINRLTVCFAATAEVEYDDSEGQQRLTFGEAVLADQGTIDPGERIVLPFRLEAPWETPFNNLRGRHFDRMKIGVQTRIDLPGGRDATDFDPIDVHPLPIHEAAVEGMERLGFRLKNADLEKGRISGSTLPFYNEIEFAGHGRTPEVELTFVTGAQQTSIVIEVSRQGLLTSGDRQSTISGPTQEPHGVDWAQLLGARVEQLAGGRW